MLLARTSTDIISDANHGSFNKALVEINTEFTTKGIKSNLHLLYKRLNLQNNIDYTPFILKILKIISHLHLLYHK